jgi:hypothetical protein
MKLRRKPSRTDDSADQNENQLEREPDSGTGHQEDRKRFCEDFKDRRRTPG